MLNLSSRFLIIALLLYLTITSANAKEYYTDIKLVANKTEILPEETITVAIINDISPKWHVYWANPGDSGEELKISWSGIEGLTFESIIWPVPKKIYYEGLTNYGYENQVTLLQDITFPKMLPDGAFDLTADISVLVCEEICIPEYHTVSLTFNGNSKSDPQIIESAKSFMPKQTQWSAFFDSTDDKIEITVKDNIDEELRDPELFSKTKGFISHSGDVIFEDNGESLKFSVFKGDIDPKNFKESTMLIKYYDTNSVEKAFEVSVRNSSAEMSDSKSQVSNLSFGLALIFAFLGGIVLNLMPCVFPILSLKILSLVKMQEHSHAQVKRHGIAYTLGILLSFVILSGLLLILKSAGQGVGWGFQLQNPFFIFALSYLILLIGLNLIGFFEISSRFSGIGSNLTNNKNTKGSFFTGVLATLVATPCTAPFMGVALGYALTQPSIVAMSVFLALGLGLSFPFLLLCYIPSAIKIMPKPGGWMVAFKEFLSFPMFATSIWLLWVLSIQTSTYTLIMVLSGFLLLVFGIWIYKKANNFVARFFAIIVLLISLFPFLFIQSKDVSYNKLNEEKDFISFTNENFQNAIKGNSPVFVNMTAAWCITCKVNEKLVLRTADTKSLFESNDVTYIVGDWTDYNGDITKYLEKYNRNGVPLYVYYGPRNAEGKRPEAVILPQILTSGIIKETINK